MNKEKLVEKMADIEHTRWAKWQKYMHSNMIIADMPNGQRFAMLPIDLFQRWEGQIKTPYADLSEKEKESDREQVRPYLKYMKVEETEILNAQQYTAFIKEGLSAGFSDDQVDFMNKWLLIDSIDDLV